MKFLNNIESTKTVAVEFTAATDELKKLYWDDFNRTLSLEIGNGVIQQIGQEQYIIVRNNTLSTIPNGTLVMVLGAIGESGRLIVQPVVSGSSTSAFDILGITTEEIMHGEDGLVTTFGLVNNIDTTGSSVSEVWVAGDALYPHPTIEGALTKNQPIAPKLKAIVARVNYVDSINGNIFIRVQHGSYLGSDHNVQFTDLSDSDLIFYNQTSGLWENIKLNNIRFNADQIDVEDIGNYYDETNVESVFQEVGAHTNVQDAYIADLLSTGVYEFTGLTKIDDTHFSVGVAKGYIVDNTTDHANPTIIHIDYPGSDSILATNIGVSYQTQVFLDSTGNLYFESTDIPTCPSRRDRIFLGRVVHPSTIITTVEAIPDFVQSPTEQLRDLWKGLGVINDKNYIYSNNTPSTNLSLALHGGTIYYNGVNFVTNKKRPTRKTIDSQALLAFNYRTRTGAGSNGNTVLDPTQYDNNGILTTMPAIPKSSTNQRVYLSPAGLILIQYGQQYYQTLAEAIAGLPSESFQRAPGIEYNAILIGVISITRSATDLTSSNAKFHSVSKFGELGGGGAGAGAAVAAQDVVISDTGNYFTSSNAEGALQEIGYSLANIADTNTISIVDAGTGINVSVVESPTQTFTYTVSHEDTSTLSGTYGTEGIQSVTFDGMGHVTEVTVNTYLTSSTQSKDFSTILVTDNDTDYTWQDTGSVSADIVGDTVIFVSDGGIEVNVDPVADAIQFVNSDRGSSQNIFKNIAVAGQNTISSEINDDTLTLVAGDYISITTDSATDTITIGTTGLSLDWSAIQNKPDPTITLGGDLSGSVTLTDLASGTLNATINANSVALGVDTTGEYVATITQGSGIVVTGGTGETSTPTIAHGDTSSATSISSDNSNGIVIQDVTITLDEFGHATAASVETVDLDGRYYTETEVDTNFQSRSEKGQPNGYASLGSDGLVPSAQLPSYVDDILEYANLESFPEIGETGKIYVALNTNKTYRWSGSTYVYITSGAVDSVGGYTGVVSASNLLTAIETVDGSGSGLDADLLDGQDGTYYATDSNLTTHIENDVRHTNYSLADGTNDYLINLDPVPESYISGMLINFKVTYSNTDNSTLNCNSLGAISIFKNVTQQLAPGDIKAGQIVTVIYDGTNFQIISGSGGSTEIGDFLDIDSLAVVKSYFGPIAPDGWEWTQGQALSRELYADLFAIIGTTYGSGDGLTTFNIPSIGTNYIIKVASSGNHGIVSNPVSYIIGNYTQKSVQLQQTTPGTSELLSFSATEFMSAELTLQITQGPKFEIIKTLLITNNVDIYLEHYGHTGIYTDAVISASLNNSIVSITITTVDAAAIVKGSIQLIAV